MNELFELFKQYHIARNMEKHLVLKVFEDESGYVTTFDGEEIFSFHSIKNGKKKLRKRIIKDFRPEMFIMAC